MSQTGVPEPIRLTVRKRFKSMSNAQIIDMVTKVVDMARELAPYLDNENASGSDSGKLVAGASKVTDDATGTH